MENEAIAGQMSIFDFLDRPKKLRPCDYRFRRYIGQKVQFNHGRDILPGIYTVKEIEKYYTIVIDEGGRELAGTPTTIFPVDDNDYFEEGET